jgi:hypothetical protein
MDAPRLRSVLLRSSVIAAANWPAVVTQFVVESVVKALAGIPVAGAAVLLLLLSVPDASAPDRDGLAAGLAVLATAPAALAAVAASAVIAAAGAIAFGAVIRAGTVAVIVTGEARARGVGRPLRGGDLIAAQAWSRRRFVAACGRFGGRFVRLGLGFALIEAIVALGYASAVVQAYRGFVSISASWWIAPAVALASLVALAASLAAELIYRLAQLVLVVEDGGAWAAVRGARALVRAEPLLVARIWLAALLCSATAFVVTLIAAAAFGLVSFVPVAGVAVLPLQAAVWVVRGLLLPFIDLAALAAYSAVLRRRRAATSPGTPASAGLPLAAGAPIPLAETGSAPRPPGSR